MYIDVHTQNVKEYRTPRLSSKLPEGASALRFFVILDHSFYWVFLYYHHSCTSKVCY